MQVRGIRRTGILVNGAAFLVIIFFRVINMACTYIYIMQTSVQIVNLLVINCVPKQLIL